MESEKKKRGRWKEGESGNPKGRPPGVGEVTKLRNSIAEHVPEIIERVVSRAKSGDTQAARLLLERVIPPLKPIELPVALSLPPGEGLAAQGVAIVQAVIDGALSPSQGATLLPSLGTLAHLKEIDELERRLSQLEGLQIGND